MLLRVYYRRHNPNLLIATILIILGVITDCVTSRSITPDDSNFTIDRSEVPARYVFEIDEVQDELYEIDKSIRANQGNLDSSLMFNMPIAVAVFCAVIFLVCCFCCLRCAVTYDGINRNGFYERKKRSNIAKIIESLSVTHEPLNEKK